MTISHNHLYKVLYDTSYYDLGSVGVADYGKAPVASYQLEFLAMDDDPVAVVKAIKGYDANDSRHVLEIFHAAPSARDLKKQYTELGYEFIRTGPILGYEITSPVSSDRTLIRNVESHAQLELANEALAVEDENIPAATLEDPHIHNFVAILGEKIAGWIQLVTIFPDAGYINHIYTLTQFRNRKIGTQLMARAHEECLAQDITRVALVPKNTAMGLYRRIGYLPVAYFTALRPKKGK